MIKKVYFNLFVALIFMGQAAIAQTTITGTLIDSEDNLALPGVNILVSGTEDGTVSDANGKFQLKTSKTNGTIEFSFVGYDSRKLKFNGSKSIGSIVMETSNQSLETVTVFAGSLIDVADGRKTPIAVSTISAKTIKDKAGNQEFPEIFKNTPSVYVNNQAGGYGDGAVYVRGFDQTNTAFLLNGQPINGMEDGKMYWSNWQGMTDIANAVQVQRGLGSSKLAISSVGGTVNIITKATEKEQGGFANVTYGNDNYYKAVLGYNTGIMDNGWGISALVTQWGGDGYNDGTQGAGQNYFLSVGYQPNDAHNFNFMIFGAPQYHDQNFRKSIQSYLDNGLKYNSNWGTLDGQYITFRRNYYHKPVANLNWEWNINEKSSLSTVLYASWGRGGGTGPLGNTRLSTPDGQVDFDAIVAANATVPNLIGSFADGGGLKRASVNNHSWYGVVTNYNYEMGDHWEFNIGADARSYEGTHFRQLINTLGLQGYTDTRNVRFPNGNTITNAFSSDPWSALTNFADVSERYAWDYNEFINYAGVFGQAEYKTELFSVFAQAAVSTQSHVRFDRYQYNESNEESPTVTNQGFNVKTGASYSLNENNKLYANVGYYSRQPYHDNIYLNFGNDVNPLTENEKVTGYELGYNFRSDLFDINVNLYSTNWKDRVTTDADEDSLGNQIYNNNSGVNQLHNGIEVDFNYRSTSRLSFTGFASIGDWTYNDDVYERVFDEDQNLVSEIAEDVDGGKVGNAAQTTLGIGARYYLLKGLSLDLDYRYYDNLYADEVTKDNLKLPAFGLLDLGVSYFIPLGGKQSLGFRANVNNLLNEEYISQSSTAIFTDTSDPTSNQNEYNGINTSNSVYFGNGTTWNLRVSYNF